MKHVTLFFCLFLCLLTWGCKLGPNPQRPPNVADQAKSFIHVTSPQPEEPPQVGQWWKRFGDPVIDDLVAKALEGNTDLRGAAARVLEARALYAAATGQRFPQVGANLSRDRRKNSFSLPDIGRVGILSTTYNIGLNVSWQADLFGKLAREQEAAWAGILAAEAEKKAMLHSIIAEVVRLRATIATLQRRLHIARENTTNWNRTRKIIERRYRRGVASVLDLRLARENLAATRAAEPELEYQLQSALHGLDVILGCQPGTGKPLPETLSDLPPLETPPVGVPATLLDRRPDLLATELRSAAATARIGVAMADLFPDLSITATGGYSADKYYDLFRPDTKVYDLLADLAWRIFAGGALEAHVEVAEAQAEAAAVEYASAVLNALREVEDALARDHTAQDRYKELEIRLKEARAAERLANERYQRGVEPLVTVLETERRRRIAQELLVLTRQVLWNARISLFLAMGGDWQVEAGKETNEAAQKNGLSDRRNP